MVNDIKQDLINKISTTTNENLLLLLKTDYEYVTDSLSEDDKKELANLESEPFGFDTIIQQELDEAIRQRRMLCVI